MRGGSKQVGCLSGNLTRIGEGLTGEMLRLGEGLSGSLKRKGKRLTGYISMVCTSNRSAYLMVSKDTLWLTPDMIAEQFEIISNVTWEID